MNPYVILVASVVALAAGLLSWAAPFRNYWRDVHVAPFGWALCFAGLALISMPFWTELVVKVGQWEVRVSQLQEEVAELSSTLAANDRLVASVREQVESPGAGQNFMAVAGAISAAADTVSADVSDLGNPNFGSLLLSDLNRAGYAVVPVDAWTSERIQQLLGGPPDSRSTDMQKWLIPDDGNTSKLKPE